MSLKKLPHLDEFEKVNWQEEIKKNIQSISELGEYFPLTEEEKQSLEKVINNHPMNITRYYLSLINLNDPDDPIRKLSIPSVDELIVAGQRGATTEDPYGDDQHNKGNGILHKYPYSVLVVATEYCSMYCRHCFRKRLVGLPTDKTVENFFKAAEYISQHKEITNVIISGGDPMMLPTSSIIDILESLRKIDHLNFVRIGTRVPVVFPMRIFDEALLNYFSEFNEDKPLYIPTHFNHANEITKLAKKALLQIRKTGTIINNQAVFLRGVNDSEEAIFQLMSQLTRAGVNPYYLYQCMPVSRVRHHFQVPLMQGVDIVGKAKRRLDGYGKRFKFIMGDKIGKIEICGRVGNKLIMNQIHACAENFQDASRIITGVMDENSGWFNDLNIV